MEPQETINDLSQALREVHAEDTLHLLIASRLEALRVLYRRQNNAFSDEQIVFLQHVKQIDASLMTFIELKEEFIGRYLRILLYKSETYNAPHPRSSRRQVASVTQVSSMSLQLAASPSLQSAA